jgi:hypothetical protein
MHLQIYWTFVRNIDLMNNLQTFFHRPCNAVGCPWAIVPFIAFALNSNIGEHNHFN